MAEVAPMQRLRLYWGVLLGACIWAAAASPVHAQTATPATVSRVVDGHTVEALLTDGRQLTARLIGIDTPETVRPGVEVECGGEQATEAMRGLVEGQQVSLVSDPTQGRSSGGDRDNARAGGIDVANRHGSVWTIRDGKAVRFRWFKEPGEPLEAAGLSD